MMKQKQQQQQKKKKKKKTKKKKHNPNHLRIAAPMVVQMGPRALTSGPLKPLPKTLL